MSRIVMPVRETNIIIDVRCFEAVRGKPEPELLELKRRYTWPTCNGYLLQLKKPHFVLSADSFAETLHEYAKMLTWVADDLAEWLPLNVRAEVRFFDEKYRFDENPSEVVFAFDVMGSVCDGD